MRELPQVCVNRAILANTSIHIVLRVEQVYVVVNVIAKIMRSVR